MQLVKRHLILQQSPSELRFIINERYLRDGVGSCSGRGIEFLRDGLGGVLELFEEGGGDGEEVDAGEGLDFASLDKGEEKGEII